MLPRAVRNRVRRTQHASTMVGKSQRGATSCTSQHSRVEVKGMASGHGNRLNFGRSLQLPGHGDGFNTLVNRLPRLLLPFPSTLCAGAHAAHGKALSSSVHDRGNDAECGSGSARRRETFTPLKRASAGVEPSDFCTLVFLYWAQSDLRARARGRLSAGPCLATWERRPAPEVICPSPSILLLCSCCPPSHATSPVKRFAGCLLLDCIDCHVPSWWQEDCQCPFDW